MKLKIILTYLILIILLAISYYLNWLYWLLEFILSILLYTLIFFLFHYIIKRIRKKEVMYFPNFMNYFLQRITLFLLFIITFFGWLAYLSNEVYPAPMPEYTITNWTKVVKFQAMSHIWTQSFYNNVAKNLTDYKKGWWVYFFEWVKPWTEENLEKFNKAIWIKFDEDLYKNFSKLYWVTNQDNNDFLWLVNDLDFNVDISMDEIVELYEEKISNKPDSKEFESKIPINANKVILETLSELNDRQLKILVYINQAILNFIIWNDSTQNFLTNNFANKDLFDVILWERNKVIAYTIVNSEYDKIYMTYWLLHFKWVLALLQENDSNWQIVSVKNLYPIK